MDNRHFDNLTRGIAQGVSRRDVLKLLVAAVAGIGASSILKFGGEELSIGIQTAAAAQFACADDNIVSLPCEQYHLYLTDCGVKCPDGTRVHEGDIVSGVIASGEGCTTPPELRAIDLKIYDLDGQLQRKLHPKYEPLKGWFIPPMRITWQWEFSKLPDSAAVRFTPTDISPCCGDQCKQQFIDREFDVRVHELEHVSNYYEERDRINAEILLGFVPTNEPFGISLRIEETPGKSRDNAIANFNSRVKDKQDTIKDIFWDREKKRGEPPYDPKEIDCSTCKKPGIDEVCCKGQCLPSNQCYGCENCGDTQCCDPMTNTCVDTCPDCQTCQNGTCMPIICDECMHCENGLCVRACAPEEGCCGNRCYNPSELRPCGPAGDGCYLCSANLECCAGSRTCCDTTLSRCCDGVCMPYGPLNCGDCRQCGPGQQCCRGPQGQIYGCADTC